MLSVLAKLELRGRHLSLSRNQGSLVALRSIRSSIRLLIPHLGTESVHLLRLRKIHHVKSVIILTLIWKRKLLSLAECRLWLIEGARRDLLIVPAILFRFIDDSLETVNQIFMVLVGVKHVETA